jgi:hypothetical protein
MVYLILFVLLVVRVHVQLRELVGHGVRIITASLALFLNFLLRLLSSRAAFVLRLVTVTFYYESETLLENLSSM